MIVGFKRGPQLHVPDPTICREAGRLATKRARYPFSVNQAQLENLTNYRQAATDAVSDDALEICEHVASGEVEIHHAPFAAVVLVDEGPQVAAQHAAGICDRCHHATAPVGARNSPRSREALSCNVTSVGMLLLSVGLRKVRI